MADQNPQLWFIWVPGEEAPQMHTSRQSAAAQADLAARLHVGVAIHLYQLKSIGSITYPNTPLIIGDMIRV
jgi:hypothetical protein